MVYQDGCCQFFCRKPKWTIFNFVMKREGFVPVAIKENTSYPGGYPDKRSVFFCTQRRNGNKTLTSVVEPEPEQQEPQFFVLAEPEL
jgi:hypothetical protein